VATYFIKKSNLNNIHDNVQYEVSKTPIKRSEANKTYFKIKRVLKCLCWRPEKNFRQQFGWLRSWLYPSARYGVYHRPTSPEHLSILQRLRKEFPVSLKLLRFPLHHNLRYSPPGL